MKMGMNRIKRMSKACDKFEIMSTPINEEVVSTAIFGEDIENGNAIYLKDGGTAVNLTKNQALFPIKQLFSIVDGRLSTSISDIWRVLRRSVFTNELPEILDEVESAKPDWYMQAKELIDYIKWRNYTDDFVKLMDILDKDFSKWRRNYEKSSNRSSERGTW